MPHFNDLDPDAPFGHYDDNHDYSDGLGSKLGPYNPLHPIREGFMMGVSATIVVGVIVWIIYRMV